MTPPRERPPLRHVLIIGVLAGVTTFLVAVFHVESAFGLPHERHGAIVGGWIVLVCCLSPLVLKLMKRSSLDGPRP